jgi:hypothetical protein
MNGFALRTATAALSFVAVGCTASHAYKPTIARPPVEGAVMHVESKDSISAAGGAVHAVAARADDSCGATPAAPGPHGARPLVGDLCACGKSGCNGGCGYANGHWATFKQKLRDCDWEQLRTDHCWPEQYNYESRRRVHAPLHDQIASGHATHNTLHDAHFETKPDMRGMLNEAGRLRLAYFARRKPYVVPSVFVQTTFDAAIDEQRNKQVFDFLQTVSTEPTDWQIASVSTYPTGQYGEEGRNAISKMIGPRQGANVPTPYYERILKNNFFLGTGGGQAQGGGGGS